MLTSPIEVWYVIGHWGNNYV